MYTVILYINPKLKKIVSQYFWREHLPKKPNAFFCLWLDGNEITAHLTIKKGNQNSFQRTQNA